MTNMLKRFETEVVMRALRQPGGLLDQAEAVLRRALATDPCNAGALLRLGDVHRRKGDFPAALEALVTTR